MTKRIAIVDCNNFYVSCERVFRPDLRNRPVVVLSNNDGCIVARSNEIKNAGIPMGVPLFEVRDQLKKMNCEVMSSNYALYGDMSDRVMKTLAEFTDEMEVYSIDEAFLSLDHISADQLLEFGREIREKVYKNTGIPVSVGIAETKTLSKIANELAKKDSRKRNMYNGVLNLNNNPYRNEFLKKVEVGDIWGVGRQYSKMLIRNGIENAYQLTLAKDDWIKKSMTIQGLRMVKELRGQACIELEQVPNSKKGIISSKSFGKPLYELNEIKEAVATYATRIGEKLRKQNSATSFLYVFLMANRFKNNSYYNSRSIHLPIQSSYTPDLVKHSLSLLEQIYIPGLKYQKAGVMVQNLTSDSSIQLSLFDKPSPEFEKQSKLMTVLDKLNKKYGRNSVKVASLGVKQNWKLRAEMRSPRYTTVWEEVLKVS